MKSHSRWFAFSAAVLVFSVPLAFAQDTGRGGEPVRSSIDVAALKYDYLVDGTLPQDDPAAKRFKTLQAAYAAAPAGTAAHPTVIGIKPNVYAITGTALTPGMNITKDYITFLGLTNNRRNVVLADNRGNKLGGGTDVIAYNGYVLVVNATGFSLQNLTVVNYCNNDYEYPGDPSKNLKLRSPIVTQAVAIDMSGDKHTYINVAMLSRLDTIFLKTTRSYFKDVYIEGTADFIGGGTISYWEDCVIDFPEGGGLPFATNIAFVNSRFTATRGFGMYKLNGAARPVALIDCVVPANTPQTPIVWTRGEVSPRPNFYSLTYHLKDPAGKPVQIWDSSATPGSREYSRELSDQEVLAYNSWNLLRATPMGDADDWDPAGVKAKYEAAGQGSLIYRMALTNPNPSIRAGAKGATIGATVAPKRAADQTIKWSTPSSAVSLSATSGATITVTGNASLEKPQYVPVTATAANGHCATTWVFVEPPYLTPPALIGSLKLNPPANGAVTLDYAVALGGNEDQSLVSWFASDDASGKDARPVAVSRGNEPLKAYALAPGDVGKFLKVTVQPKHNRSDPGAAVSLVAAQPIVASDVKSATVSPNFRSFVTDTNPTYVADRWTLLGTWTAEADTDFVNGFGVRVGSQGASMLYNKYGEVGDMQVDVVLTPEKGDGKGFGSPGTGGNGDRDQKCDIYIKYDPLTKNGYSLRFWRAVDEANKCVFQIFRLTNGAGSPVSDRKVVSGTVRPNMHFSLKVAGDKLSATVRNDRDREAVALEETIAPNRFGGTGLYWSGTTHAGNSADVSQFKITYPARD